MLQASPRSACSRRTRGVLPVLEYLSRSLTDVATATVSNNTEQPSVALGKLTAKDLMDNKSFARSSFAYRLARVTVEDRGETVPGHRTGQFQQHRKPTRSLLGVGEVHATDEQLERQGVLAEASINTRPGSNHPLPMDWQNYSRAGVTPRFNSAAEQQRIQSRTTSQPQRNIAGAIANNRRTTKSPGPAHTARRPAGLSFTLPPRTASPRFVRPKRAARGKVVDETENKEDEETTKKEQEAAIKQYLELFNKRYANGVTFDAFLQPNFSIPSINSYSDYDFEGIMDSKRRWIGTILPVAARVLAQNSTASSRHRDQFVHGAMALISKRYRKEQTIKRRVVITHKAPFWMFRKVKMREKRIRLVRVKAKTKAAAKAAREAARESARASREEARAPGAKRAPQKALDITRTRGKPKTARLKVNT